MELGTPEWCILATHYTLGWFKNLLVLRRSKLPIHPVARKVDTDKDRDILVGGASAVCLPQRKVIVLLLLPDLESVSHNRKTGRRHA